MLYSAITVLQYAFNTVISVTGDTVSISANQRELLRVPTDPLLTTASAILSRSVAFYKIDAPYSSYSMDGLGLRLDPAVLSASFDQSLFESLVVPTYKQHNASSIIDDYLQAALDLSKENNTYNLARLISCAHDVFVDLRLNPKIIESDQDAPYCSLDEVLNGKRCSVKGPLNAAEIAGLKVVFPTGIVTKTMDFMVKALLNLFQPIGSSDIDINIPWSLEAHSLARRRTQSIARERHLRRSKRSCQLFNAPPQTAIANAYIRTTAHIAYENFTFWVEGNLTASNVAISQGRPGCMGTKKFCGFITANPTIKSIPVDMQCDLLKRHASRDEKVCKLRSTVEEPQEFLDCVYPLIRPVRLGDGSANLDRDMFVPLTLLFGLNPRKNSESADDWRECFTVCYSVICLPKQQLTDIRHQIKTGAITKLTRVLQGVVEEVMMTL